MGLVIPKTKIKWKGIRYMGNYETIRVKVLEIRDYVLAESNRLSRIQLVKYLNDIERFVEPFANAENQIALDDGKDGE